MASFFSVTLAATALTGCLMTVERVAPLPDEDAKKFDPAIPPGSGGALAWVSTDYSSDVIPLEEVLRDLRSSGVFTRVEDTTPEIRRDPPDIPEWADWILSMDGGFWVDEPRYRPEVPEAPFFTFGLIPYIDPSRETFLVRLRRRTGGGHGDHVIHIPGEQEHVTGFFPALVLSLHPDWFLTGAEEARMERHRRRLVAAILRHVAESR